MERKLKIIAFMTLLLALPMVVPAFANDYDKVGGELGPIDFIMTFVVPVLAIVAIFGAMVIFGLVRIRVKTK